MHLSILRLGILLTLAVLGVSAATAQTELYFATGVDSTGWAQAQSNADGHVLIESPQYPRGLWLDFNRIADLTLLASLTNLNTLVLIENRIEDISPLVANPSLSEGDKVYLAGNPLSDQARNEQIPALKARGVIVLY
jgi:hypothetical protein